jgi:hypothetical protein
MKKDKGKEQKLPVRSSCAGLCVQDKRPGAQDGPETKKKV